MSGGVGPSLPFQMLGSAWVGLGAGLLPPAKGRDLIRGVTTAPLGLPAAAAGLFALRRASRRAALNAPVDFVDSPVETGSA